MFLHTPLMLLRCTRTILASDRARQGPFQAHG